VTLQASGQTEPQTSIEPLPASIDPLMKRTVPTLRFSTRKPRSPQAGLSLFRRPNVPAAGKLKKQDCRPEDAARSTGADREDTCDGVIGFPHRRKISSALIRNTVAPIAIRTALRSCWRLKRGSRSHDNKPCKAPGAKTAASRTAAPRVRPGRTGASRTTVSANK
jgi:hypothetical protein